MIDNYTIPNSDEYHTWDFNTLHNDGFILNEDEGVTYLDEIDEILEVEKW